MSLRCQESNLYVLRNDGNTRTNFNTIIPQKYNLWNGRIPWPICLAVDTIKCDEKYVEILYVDNGENRD